MHFIHRIFAGGLTALAWFVLASVCALVTAESAIGAVTTSTHTTYQVRRGSANVPPTPTTEAECIRRAHEGAAKEGETRETGASDHQCHKVLHVLAVFRPNPPTPLPIACVVSEWGGWSASGPWSTCSNRQQTRTEQRTRTVITPPANGGAACPTLTESRSVSQACSGNGVAALSWTAPTRNSNGTALTNLAGFRVRYGRAPDALAQTINLANPGISRYDVSGLEAGSWYFTISAVNDRDAESAASNMVVKVIP